VFEQKPPPPDHLSWHHPRIIVTLRAAPFAASRARACHIRRLSLRRAVAAQIGAGAGYWSNYSAQHSRSAS